MTPILLFRIDDQNENESQIAKDIWRSNFTLDRDDIPKDSVVFCRYSVQPFFEEFQEELAAKNSAIINSYQQHRFIADMKNWYNVIEELTPQTWFTSNIDNIPETRHGYVVKGVTNSRKQEWNTQMFSPSKDNLFSIVETLQKDPLIGQQEIVIREFHPLEPVVSLPEEKQYQRVTGPPPRQEWRCFFLGDHLISAGFYWSNIKDKISNKKLPAEAEKLAVNVASLLSPFCNFFVVDVAKKADGEWIVIEINEGMMSGLSTIDASTFYQNLLKRSNQFIADG